jgi:predicted aspartyl protease
MSVRFAPHEELIYLRAKVFGTKGRSSLRLALDTGASSTMINRRILRRLGYELSAGAEGVGIITGSRVELASPITVSRFSALRQQRRNFPVLAYDMPPEAGIDGVLGLDFFRGQNLNIDFRTGLITLS